MRADLRDATPRPFRTDAGHGGWNPISVRAARPEVAARLVPSVCFPAPPGRRFCSVPAMEGVRWAFPCGTWLPSRAEWLLAVRSIQPEEKERIGQFVFARDAKAAMVLRGLGIVRRGRSCWGRRAGDTRGGSGRGGWALRVGAAAWSPRPL